MLRTVLTWAVIIAIGWGAISWLAEPGNGHDAGKVAGNMAGTAGDGVGGAFDAVEGFFKGLSSH